MAAKEFLCRSIISFAPSAVGVPLKNCLPMAWGFTKADGARDDASVESFWEVVFDLLDYLA